MEALEKLVETLRQVQHNLRNVKVPWLVGGSCGLLLQGVPLNAAPRDLDLYADSAGAKELHAALSAYSVDGQIEDQSGIYRSVLSHYLIGGIKVELVGGFEVMALDSVYKVDAAFLYEAHSLEITTSLEGDSEFGANGTVPVLKLMPLEHELLFNLLRNRPDRYKAIAEVMRSRFAGMTPTMGDLILRNTLSDRVTTQLKQLLQTKNEQ